ncbi:MAG: tetratricopeptide repeat protein [Pleurocapsa sp. MO_192.B19]|nr:tetratricopeptide repeat protein [Pleurocapsa sp. MO_192.B19]
MSNFLNRLKSKAQEQINNIENETLKNAAKVAQVAVDRGYQSTKKALEEAKVQAQIKVAEAIKLQQQKTFDLALDMAKKENYSQAIIFLKNIPANSELYTEAQSQIAVYEQAAKKSKDERIFSRAIALAEQEEYTQAIKTLKQISEESSIYLDVENKITEYVEQVKIIEEKIAVEFLEKAANLADQEEYSQALMVLEQIYQDTSAYIEAQAKKNEYQELIRDKKAQLLLEKAINNANEGKYRESIEILNQISNETKIYTEVQEIIEQYQELIKIEEKKLAEELFNRAITFAEQKKYTQAIDVLQQIAKTTEYYDFAQNNIVEYKRLKLEKEANSFYSQLRRGQAHVACN